MEDWQTTFAAEVNAVLAATQYTIRLVQVFFCKVHSSVVYRIENPDAVGSVDFWAAGSGFVTFFNGSPIRIRILPVTTDI